MRTHLAYKKRNLSLGFNIKSGIANHEFMNKRFTKTLYYGKSPRIERPSLSLTDLSVKMFSKAVPSDHLGFIDMEYASQIGREACISPCSMMIAMVYIERLRSKNPEYIQSVSSSDLFLVSMMIAAKFLNDEGEEDEVFNEEWATSANMDIKDLNKLEREFLTAISWEVFVRLEDFADIMANVEACVALKESGKRGWMSYTDLDILAQTVVLMNSWKLMKENVIQVITICSVAYAAVVFVIIGSTALVSCGFKSANLSHLLAQRPSELFNIQSSKTDYQQKPIDFPSHSFITSEDEIAGIASENSSNTLVSHVSVFMDLPTKIWTNQNCSQQEWTNGLLFSRKGVTCR